MNIDLVKVRQMFQAVLDETGSREAVSEKAKQYQQADDRRELVVTPEGDRDRVWKALIFLEGVDLKDGPDSYLHVKEDVVRERP